MKILVGIATYKRPKKLIRLLKSLEKQTYKKFDTFVVFDNNDKESLEDLKEYSNLINPIISDKQLYVIGCWNRVHKIRGYAAHLTLCDDVELLPDCIEKAVDTLRSNYFNLDGVVGITQLYPGQSNVFFQPTGQVLVGEKFLQRFKDVDYQICCPNYVQWYQDEELLDFSSALQRFILAYDAQLIHHHPSFYPKEMDVTHTLVRGNNIQANDKRIYLLRKSKGLTWGRSWELVS